MIEFMAALYNEEDQIESLLDHIAPFVSKFILVDDGSTDSTVDKLYYYPLHGKQMSVQCIKHTGLPESVKGKALKSCDPDSWVIMLDADERFADGVLDQINEFINSPMADEYTHVWFTLREFIDNTYTKSFIKCRLFRARDAHFAIDTVHTSDWFDGKGANFGWVVNHRKTAEKQIQREYEYIETYKHLVSEGKMSEEKMRENIGYHYFVRG